MNRARLEALKLAVQVACVGSYENAGHRLDTALLLARAFELFLGGGHAPDPENEPQSGELAVPKSKAEAA